MQQKLESMSMFLRMALESFWPDWKATVKLLTEHREECPWTPKPYFIGFQETPEIKLDLQFETRPMPI